MSRRGVSSRGLGGAASGIGGLSTRPAPSTAATASAKAPSQATGASSASTPAASAAAAAGTSGAGGGAAAAVATSAGPSGRSAGVGSRVAARGPGVGGGGGNLARVHDPSGRISEYWAQDDKCPQCKTDRLIAPKLRLLVSPCYHKMCESCVDRIFSLGSAPCPECGTTCRKNQFGVQTFSDLGVEREVDVRRRVAKVYNKQEKDFPDLKAYNNYLEEVEEITFNLIHHVDLDRTEARIAMHEHANRSLINRNAFSLSSASAALASAEEAERGWRKARAVILRRREEEDAQDRERERRELVDRQGGEDDDEAVRALRTQQAERRRERAESRRREDEEAERQRIAMIGALAATGVGANGRGRDGPGASSGGNASGTQDGIDIAAGLYRPWQPEMLLDFEGPLARLDDARDIFVVPLPPARLLGASTATPTSTSTSASTSDAAAAADALLWAAPESAAGSARGYHDLANEQPRAEADARKVRAGGYDWSEVLRRRLRSGLEGMWIAPLEDAAVPMES